MGPKFQHDATVCVALAEVTCWKERMQRYVIFHACMHAKIIVTATIINIKHALVHIRIRIPNHAVSKTCLMFFFLEAIHIALVESKCEH